MALTGMRTGIIDGQNRPVILHATRNTAGRIIGVGLTVPGIGEVSFAHVREGEPGNAAERLEALRGSACPMSAVRMRRENRAEQGAGSVSEFTDTDTIG